ncbi:MAG: endonuclease VIII [Syntrophomonadaceae bacterium]|nr:endonuclease VIII [Syntrophomonadaceae bacterium]
MIEIPEANVLARQIGESLSGNEIVSVVAAKSAHKFTWYYGDPQDYHDLLVGKRVEGAAAFGGQVEIKADSVRILFSDGVNLRYHEKGGKRPLKHQLLIEFADGSGLSASVQMYGGICCFREGEYDNVYYRLAKAKPGPLSAEFDREYFAAIIHADGADRLSINAIMATEQRIPGLGNGTLQDVLFNAGLHPKRRVTTLTPEEEILLFESIKTTIRDMIDGGGRDTEKDLYGNPGGYQTKLSKNTAGKAFSRCGTTIKKESYMGGSIYYCPHCQEQ